MQKFLLTLLFALLTIPFVSFAAFNDVTLTTDAVINVASININVSGSSATLESTVVNSDSFSVTLLAGSAVSLSTGSRQTLTPNVSYSNYVQATCSSSAATLDVTFDPDWGTSKVLTITPSSSACSTAATGGGGGGGGGGSTAATVVATTPATTFGIAVGLTVSQAQSILDLLAAFDTEQSIIDSVRDVLSGKSMAGIPSTAASISGLSGTFTVAFRKGDSSTDVKRLQQLLNSDPDTVLATSGVGSAGSETNYYGSLTEAAIQKFQAKHGIVSSGDPATTGYGRLGPQTRSKLKEIFGD